VMARGTQTIRVTGLDKAIKKYDPKIVQLPLRRFFLRSTTIVNQGVTRRTKKVTGEARGSIKIRIDPAPVPKWGKVFSDLFRMRFLEFGTKPHAFPVTGKFIAYARKKRVDPYVLMNAIARGGTKGRRMFRKTNRGTRRKIFAFGRQAAEEMARKLVAN